MIKLRARSGRIYHLSEEPPGEDGIFNSLCGRTLLKADAFETAAGVPAPCPECEGARDERAAARDPLMEHILAANRKIALTVHAVLRAHQAAHGDLPRRAWFRIAADGLSFDVGTGEPPPDNGGETFLILPKGDL